MATLIHDTYLPIYLQDVLGLTNTKARLLPPACMVCARAVVAGVLEGHAVCCV